MIETLDRKKAPEIKFTDAVNFPDHSIGELDNGIPLLAINSGEQDVVKIEFVFNAGKWFEPNKLIGKLTNKLMREGSKSFSSEELAKNLDFYGATLKNQCKAYFSVFTLYALNKYLPSILPYLKEMFLEASLPENELEIIVQKQKQALKVQSQKNDYVATQEYFRMMFGERHPFGYPVKLEDYDSFNKEEIDEFYRSNYSGRISRICASGKDTDKLVPLLNREFGKLPGEAPSIDYDMHKESPSREFEFHSNIENSVQSAIRIGMPLFDKTHPDYFDFKILNTILGGYFSSRLMSNIREDKGYTYGIYSSFASLLKTGYFSIGTEVGHKYTDATMKEISFEIDRLKDELIGSDELNTVKNYMKSKIQGSTDGPFHSSKTLHDLWLYGLDKSFLNNFISRINNIEKEDLKNIARKYLDFDNMYKVIVS